jgi:hypothetical protein
MPMIHNSHAYLRKKNKNVQREKGKVNNRKIKKQRRKQNKIREQLKITANFGYID